VIPSSYDLGTRVIILSDSITIDNTLLLPIMADTTQLHFAIKLVVTGIPVGPINVTDAISHIQLATSDAMIKSIIPGEFLEANYLRFSESGTNLKTTPIAPSYEAIISIPGLRLTRSNGPWQLTIFYNSFYKIRNVGDITGAEVINHITGNYGETSGYISRHANQIFALVEGGNSLTSIVQNVSINEVIITNLRNPQNIERVLIISNGQIVESNSSGSLLQARAALRFKGTLPENTVILLCPMPFLMNANSEFQLFMKAAEPDARFLWYWYEATNQKNVNTTIIKNAIPIKEEDIPESIEVEIPEKSRPKIYIRPEAEPSRKYI
jgi:hypothetical protein